jgi:hypothetical protein
MEAKNRSLYHDGVALLRNGDYDAARQIFQSTLNHSSLLHGIPNTCQYVTIAYVRHHCKSMK